MNFCETNYKFLDFNKTRIFYDFLKTAKSYLGTHETRENTSLSGISIENLLDSIPHQRINCFKQVFAMDE